MKVITYYSKEFKTWAAYLVDENDCQLGDCSYAASKNMAILYLGMDYGRNPSKYAKTLEELLQDVVY